MFILVVSLALPGTLHELAVADGQQRARFSWKLFKADFVQDYIQDASSAKQKINNHQFVRLKPC